MATVQKSVSEEEQLTCLDEHRCLLNESYKGPTYQTYFTHAAYTALRIGI